MMTNIRNNQALGTVVLTMALTEQEPMCSLEDRLTQKGWGPSFIGSSKKCVESSETKGTPPSSHGTWLDSGL